MNHGLLLRLLPATLFALAITLAVFLFMHGLIQVGQRQAVELPLFQNVEILKPAPDEPQPETPSPTTETVTPEPAMTAIEPAPPAPTVAPELELPALQLSTGDLTIASVGERFSAPLGVAGVAIPGGGQDAQGFVEVVPYNTRKPNVPEVAWRNKISGWVLVAFSVTPGGKTRNVRVLDARPRGVFEEKVIAAVEDWQYSIQFSGRETADVVLTQRVDVRWQDYPRNLPNVD